MLNQRIRLEQIGVELELILLKFELSKLSSNQDKLKTLDSIDNFIHKIVIVFNLI